LLKSEEGSGGFVFIDEPFYAERAQRGASDKANSIFVEKRSEFGCIH